MAADRANNLKAFRDFVDEKLPNGGAQLTLVEALHLWERENSPEGQQADTPALEKMVDLEFEAFCAREGDDTISLDQVREATSRIPGSMAETIIEERAERF